jgi:hypothetical protein
MIPVKRFWNVLGETLKLRPTQLLTLSVNWTELHTEKIQKWYNITYLHIPCLVWFTLRVITWTHSPSLPYPNWGTNHFRSYVFPSFLAVGYPPGIRNHITP